MVRVFFPSMFIRLIGVNMKTSPMTAKFRIPPSMTKTEVKEYLTKIYNISVVKVATANFLGWQILDYLLRST